MQQRLLLEKFGTRHRSLKIWVFVITDLLMGIILRDLRKRFVMHPVSKDLLLFTSLPKKVEATAQLKMIRLSDCMTSGLPNQGATPLLLQRY